MDFDTERDPDKSESASPSPEEGRQRTSGGSSTAEFTYTDPVQSFVETVKNLAARPADFFSGIQRRGDFVNPLIFALICTVIYAVLSGLVGVLFALVGVGDNGVGGAIGGMIAAIFLTPIFVAIALFIGAGILHLLVMLIIKPATTGYEATFRAYSYSSVTLLFAWVPFIGSILATIASIFLLVIGVREVHGTTTGRAAAVVLIPTAVVLLLVLLLAGVALFFTLLQ